MRISCCEKWKSVDPLVTLQLGDDLDVPWEVRVDRLSSDSMHASYRMEYDGDALVPRKEDFRIYQVLEILRPVDRMLLLTSDNKFVTDSLCNSLEAVRVGDKVVVLHMPNNGGCGLHANPEFVDVVVVEE